MEKKIVVAVDSSVHAENAVRYAADLAGRIVDLHIKLLHIQPTVSHYIEEEARKSVAGKHQLETIHRKNRQIAQELLDSTRQKIRDAGVEDRRIEAVTLPKQNSVAADILQSAQDGRYDAIVVGRRGTSYLQALLTGSVTSNLLAHTKVVPVWVVDGRVRPNRILAAVDGSSQSLRAIDHLAFMMTGASNVRVAMLHVQPKLRDYCEIDITEELPETLAGILAESDSRCIDGFYGRALAIFKAAGIDERQVQLKTAANLISIGKTILKEAASEGFQTLVVGKHSRPGSLFTGSVSRYLINNASNCALWVVP